MLRKLADEEREVVKLIVEQRAYAKLGPVGRWRWRRARFGPPPGWRTMTPRARRLTGAGLTH